MATGDNMLTAVSVGKKCQIIDPEITIYLGDVAEFKGERFL
jgi:cation-transporting ATPase 13A2